MTRHVPRISGVLLVVSILLTSVFTTPVSAAPGSDELADRLVAQNVDWMSSEQAAALALDFPVLVPSWIPAPFGGSPSISASGGYYSLYWMIPGGAPTFLQITGEVGGALPAGSPADLNVQLSVNASVQGYDAIHDVTNVYDTVWWVMGGVLYKVESQNMTGTDSLSLANALITLQPPAAPEPEPEPTIPPEPEPTAPPEEPSPTGTIQSPSTIGAGESVSLEVYPSGTATLQASDGVFASSGSNAIGGLTGGPVSWQAPDVSVETTIEFSLVDEATGTAVAWASMTVVPASTGGATDEPSDGTGAGEQVLEASGQPDPEGTTVDETDVADAAADDLADEPTADPPADEPVTDAPATEAPSSEEVTQDPASDAVVDGDLPSDGTAGPPLPVGSDGTGGSRQIALP